MVGRGRKVVVGKDGTAAKAGVVNVDVPSPKRTRSLFNPRRSTAAAEREGESHSRSHGSAAISAKARAFPASADLIALTPKERGQLAQEQRLDFFFPRVLAAPAPRRRGRCTCNVGWAEPACGRRYATAASLPLLRWRDP